MKIAIIGAGISGLVAAYLLHREHEVTLFEAAPRLGGHTHTHTVNRHGRTLAIDTGFIVFNDRTYPNFCRLLDRLGVASRPSTMSFSVHDERTGLEYNGGSLRGLLAQKRNAVRPAFLAMLRDVLRFNRAAKDLIARDHDTPITLDAFVDRHGFSDAFRRLYLVPMTAAVWSTEPARVGEMPAGFVLRFFENHGMLNVWDRPRWRTVVGGSSRYVDALTRPFRDRIRVGCPVTRLRREADHVCLEAGGDRARPFDHVILACHSDQALAILDDADDHERDALAAIPYRANDAVLHTDTRLLPRRRAAWAAWNYHVPASDSELPTVTYHMNTLQGLPGDEVFCVSLNRTAEIAPDRVIARMTYDHPVFGPKTHAAQTALARLSHRRRTSFCGAYRGYGFHEDGVNSALDVCRPLGGSL